MPIFSYHCSNCKAIFEVLIDANDRSVVRCSLCRGVSRRSAVASFKIIGGGSKFGRPGRTGGDFVKNPDSFVSAMNEFGDRIGDRLSSSQMESAVEKLKRSKR